MRHILARMMEYKRQNLIFGLFISAVTVCLVWRCFYSVSTNDEAYYVGTVYRLFKGDGMLCDEWNPTQQMCSFWLFPFYVLFRGLLGSNDGMILSFRLLYICFQVIISIYLYINLKKYSYSSIGAVLFYLLSTAFNINSLSYNTMGNSCFLALMVSLCTMENITWKRGIISGILCSVVVMSNPYGILLFAVYVVSSWIVSFIRRKGSKNIMPALDSRFTIRLCVGAFLVLGAFLAFTFWHATLPRIIKNLPYIIGDQEHVQRWDVKLTSYIGYFGKYYRYCTAGIIIILAFIALDRKRKKHRNFYFITALLCVIPYIVEHGILSDYVPVNLVIIPICFLGIVTYLLSNNIDSRLFWCWYVPAMIYPFTVQLTSNTGPLAVSASYVTAGSGAVLLILLYLQEQKSEKITRYAGEAVVALQLAIMLYLRITYVWGDAGIPELTSQFETGPSKWIYSTQENVEYYSEVYEEIDDLPIKKDDGLLVVGSEPMIYLYADKEVASYSTWQVYTNETRLYRYYEVHEGEGKFPTMVYCVEADEDIFDSILVKDLLLPMGYEYMKLKHGIAFYSERDLPIK